MITNKRYTGQIIRETGLYKFIQSDSFGYIIRAGNSDIQDGIQVGDTINFEMGLNLLNPLAVKVSLGAAPAKTFEQRVAEAEQALKEDILDTAYDLAYSRTSSRLGSVRLNMEIRKALQ